MAISKIFSNASSITKGTTGSLVSTKTQAGKRVAQRRGPVRYIFSVSNNSMRYSDYLTLETEVSSLGYGEDLVVTSLPVDISRARGSWEGTPVVNGASQTGTSISISGFTPNTSGVIKEGDFIQFYNHEKVYQSTEDRASDSSGEVVVELNTDVIQSPINNSSIIYGSSVEFHLSIEEMPEYNFIPMNGNESLVETSGDWKLEEVIL